MSELAYYLLFDAAAIAFAVLLYLGILLCSRLFKATSFKKQNRKASLK